MIIRESMSMRENFLAFDLGAESGRGIIVSLDGDQVEMEEIHRFPNRRVTMGGTMYWDFPALFAEVLAGIQICAQKDVRLAGISVDTWGVDFGLLGKDGKLLGNPVCYRDGRTENIHEYSNPTMSTDRIFELTAYEPWAISSLFQLLAMQRDKSSSLEVAGTFLNIPDLFHYFLTGRKISEMSIINTSNLMGSDCRWSREIIDAFGLPAMFGDIVEPATVIGPLRKAVLEETGMKKDVPVIATCGHDTSAALAAVPAEGDNWAFLSCGTWSILGALVDKPIATKRCLELHFTNEYTIGGWYLAQNISGLWLVQELRRKWDRSEESWDYNRITAEAQAAKSGAIVNVADPSLLGPADMEEALVGLIKKTGQDAPASRGELLRCVLESLALQYNVALQSVSELTGKPVENLYLVGGGIKNKLLCQLTADACGIPVHAGVDQCTALGNALAQALTLGILKTPDDMRRVVRASFEIVNHQPEDEKIWQKKRQLYRQIQQA